MATWGGHRRPDKSVGVEVLRGGPWPYSLATFAPSQVNISLKPKHYVSSIFMKQNTIPVSTKMAGLPFLKIASRFLI